MSGKKYPKRSRGLDDLMLPFVTAPVPVAMSDVRPQAVGLPRVTTLIYADAAGCSTRLAAGLALLGRSSKVIRTPLEVVARLQDDRIAIDAVFSSLQDGRSNTAALFDFLTDEYPRVRRVAFSRHDLWRTSSSMDAFCQYDMVLWDPWDRADFVEILKDAIDCRISRTRSSWTDLRLFESLDGVDKLAIAEILKRYRYRIVRLVLDATRHRMDSQDVVQDAYLSIVRALPSFGRICSPGEWIDRITCRSIRSFFHRQMGETSARHGAFMKRSPRAGTFDELN